MDKTILGIDPGTKEMGLAVIRGKELLYHGVRTLRNGHRPYDVIGQARRVLLQQIRDFKPQLVAIEKPYFLPTKRAALLSVIAQEMHARAEELNLDITELSPERVRQAVAGNPRATKLDVALALVQSDFEILARFMPKKPERSALGFRPRDKYWLHMFDALALAVAAQRHATW